MQQSFIIKNADESFDAYYQIMKKRKLGGQIPGATLDGGMNTGGISAGLQGGSPTVQNEANVGLVQGIQPAARDGHTLDITPDGLMFVFGGDRHLMPFNDLYLMNLKA